MSASGASREQQGWHISVLIPARNEEVLLPRCLESVADAAIRLPDTCTCDVVVAVDSSCDSTFDVASRRLRRIGAVFQTNAGVVGEARALAARYALRRHAGNRARHWLANTDADCVVPPTWLVDQLVIAQQNVEAVAGIVDVDSFEEHAGHVPERFRASYVLNEDGTHPHVHGANFGVRADAYIRAGGWAPLETAEDHDLWQRLLANGVSRVSAASLKVVTSGRRIGRAPMGFADALAAHNTLPELLDAGAGSAVEVGA